MRKAGSYSVQAHVLSAKSKLGSYAHLYVLLFLLSVFALTAFFSAPHTQLSTVPLNDGEWSQRHHQIAEQLHNLFGVSRSVGSSATRTCLSHAGPVHATATASHAAAAKAAAAQAQEAASGLLVAAQPDACHTEQGAEYAGEDVIEWGNDNLKVGSLHGSQAVHALGLFARHAVRVVSWTQYQHWCAYWLGAGASTWQRLCLKVLAYDCRRWCSSEFSKTAPAVVSAGHSWSVLRSMQGSCCAWLQCVGVVWQSWWLQWACPQGVLAEEAAQHGPQQHSGNKR